MPKSWPLVMGNDGHSASGPRVPDLCRNHEGNEPMDWLAMVLGIPRVDLFLFRLQLGWRDAAERTLSPLLLILTLRRRGSCAKQS